jgi:NTP pyrophosphatase (non-canonical NTP hydrolase)
MEEDTIESIIRTLLEFRDDRNWQRFHTSPNLSHALMVEAAELGRLFQWNGEFRPKADKEAIADEIADVIIYALYIAHNEGIDAENAIYNKIDKNSIKYPVQG